MDERKRAAMDAILEHSAKGVKWKNHKYIGVVTTKNGNKRYIYKSTKSPSTVKVSDEYAKNGYAFEKASDAVTGNRSYDRRQEQIDGNQKWLKEDLKDNYVNMHNKEAKAADYQKRTQNSQLAADQRKTSYKAKIKYHATVNKVKKYVKKGKAAAKKFIDKNIKKKFTVNKNQIILPDSGARVTFH